MDIVDTAFAVHIKDRRVNKGTGLTRIAQHLNLDPMDFAAIGDSMSDRPCSRWRAFGLRGQWPPGLKEISDYVAKKDFGAGFAEIVDYMIEREMLSDSL